MGFVSSTYNRQHLERSTHGSSKHWNSGQQCGEIFIHEPPKHHSVEWNPMFEIYIAIFPHDIVTSTVSIVALVLQISPLEGCQSPKNNFKTQSHKVSGAVGLGCFAVSGAMVGPCPILWIQNNPNTMRRTSIPMKNGLMIIPRWGSIYIYVYIHIYIYVYTYIYVCMWCTMWIYIYMYTVYIYMLYQYMIVLGTVV